MKSLQFVYAHLYGRIAIWRSWQSCDLQQSQAEPYAGVASKWSRKSHFPWAPPA
jgi:hypothetical protein